MIERSKVSSNPYEFTDHGKGHQAFSALNSLDRDR